MKFIEVTEIIITSNYQQLERKILINLSNIVYIAERNTTGCGIKLIGDDGPDLVTKESYSQIRSLINSINGLIFYQVGET